MYAEPDLAGSAGTFLRHKTVVVSPDLLVRWDLDQYLVECVQRPGQMVVTFPAGYHCGFNHGSTTSPSRKNFATDTWAEIGRKASHCKCQADTVRIDVPLFERWRVEGENALSVSPWWSPEPLPPPPPKKPKEASSNSAPRKAAVSHL